MQTVLHEYENVSPIFNQIEWLYTNISDTYTKSLIPHVLDGSFSDLLGTLNENGVNVNDIKLSHYDYPKFDLRHDDSVVIVCVSGGKDSVALAKYLLDMGYDVRLYHMRGINKVYPDEHIAVKEVAKYLQVPYYIDTVILSGSQRFVEHPMKNMMIANGAIHYAIREGISPNIAFGNFNESYLEDNEFEVCAGDCMDLWYDYEKIIRKIIPGFSMMIPLHNNEETLEIIEKDIKLLPLCISCMSPYRFREHWKKRTEKKYRVSLLNNRCGCCWKCSVEILYYTDHGIFDYPFDYYAHCLQILSKTLYKEGKIKTKNVEEVWNEYLCYPIEESKYYPNILNIPVVC